MSFFTRPKRVAPVPDRLEVTIDGVPVLVRLRTHPRARRYTLRVGRGGAEPAVTMPPRGSLAAALAFIESHRGWLRVRLAGLPAVRPFADGAVIPLRGVDHLIHHRPGGRGTVSIEPGAALPVIAVAGAAEHLPRRLADWLRREARCDLEAAVFRHADETGKRPAAIRLRDQKARWGSCSAKGTLSFSWRLILAPPMVLDYLAAHEVAHLSHLNHRPAFWRLVRRICPDTDRAEAWLKAHGPDLHRVGPV